MRIQRSEGLGSRLGQVYMEGGLGLGGFCSKKALLCYAAIPMRKLYHAQHKVSYYAREIQVNVTFAP